MSSNFIRMCLDGGSSFHHTCSLLSKPFLLSTYSGVISSVYLRLSFHATGFQWTFPCSLIFKTEVIRICMWIFPSDTELKELLAGKAKLRLKSQSMNEGLSSEPLSTLFTWRARQLGVGGGAVSTCLRYEPLTSNNCRWYPLNPPFAGTPGQGYY